MKTDVLSNLVVKDVLFAATLFSEAGSRAKRVNREHWAIHLKAEGRTEYVCEEKVFISNKNNVIILPKGCSYEWECKEAGHFFAIEFECDCEHNEILSFPIKDSDAFLKLFREYERKRISKSSTAQLDGFKCVYSLLVKLVNGDERKYTPKSKIHKIAPALDYIAQNLDKSISNDSLAEVCELSTVYFRKLFTECYGISPKTYVNGLRIKKAKEMLKSDYGSITNVAQSLGYSNVYDFSRAFKKITGVPPTKYY